MHTAKEPTTKKHYDDAQGMDYQAAVEALKSNLAALEDRQDKIQQGEDNLIQYRNDINTLERAGIQATE